MEVVGISSLLGDRRYLLLPLVTSYKTTHCHNPEDSLNRSSSFLSPRLRLNRKFRRPNRKRRLNPRRKNLSFLSRKRLNLNQTSLNFLKRKIRLKKLRSLKQNLNPKRKKPNRLMLKKKLNPMRKNLNFPA